MIDKNNNRIIGDFFEINADIVQREVTSKLPKFIKHRISYRDRKKLLKAAIKIKNSDHVLNSDNLSEFFIYLYNNFPPNGKYKSVYASKYDEDLNIIEAIILFDSCKAVITIDRSSTGFDIRITDKKTNIFTESSAIHCDELSHNGSRSEVMKKINKRLKSDIADYIIEILQKYNHTGKRRSVEE